ncbi:porin [Oceanicella sp. SM1341]|uniref:porin n=1 Tax=Oceanicella sp. SM1341 TaxID=1548889 RepID=UPI000E4F7136|nr:porin [Oceanicella sp. SM1341]
MVIRSVVAATILAGGSATAGLAAEPITASVGGYMNFGLAYQSDNGDEVGVLRDGEIWFGWKGTTDNGLTFDGRVELEAATDANDQIDENWARVSGAFGAITIGSNDDASDAFEYGYFEAPSTKIGYFDSDVGVIGSSNGGDSPSIFYTTPNISGFQAMVGWSPDAGADGVGNAFHQGDGNLVFGDDTSKWSVGAGYTGEFSGVELEFGGGYFTIENGPDAWQGGATVSYQGFGVGVTYDQRGANDGEDDAIAVGAQYVTGPWTFAGGWATALSGEDMNDYGVWATYAVAPGVTGTLGYEGNDSDEPGDNTVMGYMRVSF